MRVMQKVGEGLNTSYAAHGFVDVDFCATVCVSGRLFQLAHLHHSVRFREEELVSRVYSFVSLKWAICVSVEIAIVLTGKKQTIQV